MTALTLDQASTIVDKALERGRELNLQPLTVRDATAANLATVLDFNKPNRIAPAYAIPPGPYGAPCPYVPSESSLPIGEANEWIAVKALAQSYGWTL